MEFDDKSSTVFLKYFSYILPSFWPTKALPLPISKLHFPVAHLSLCSRIAKQVILLLIGKNFLFVKLEARTRSEFESVFSMELENSYCQQRDRVWSVFLIFKEALPEQPLTDGYSRRPYHQKTK